MITPRNKIQISVGYSSAEIEFTDSLYEICDAEFNSRKDVYYSFSTARGADSWARYYLVHEVRKIALRENLYVSFHVAHMISKKISDEWFTQKEFA